VDAEGTRNIALRLEYDGTHFAGSQFQQGVRTVQGELEAAWTRLTGETRRWAFAGRTDAGVHARGQVANARTTTRHGLDVVQRALNALLPDDLAVLDAWEADTRFHARFSARERAYRYLLLNEQWPAPLLRTRTVHVPEPLDAAAMHEAATLLVGEHDFAAFGTAPTAGGSTVRHCVRAGCRRDEEADRRIIVVDIAANGFLRHMVRAVVGTLILVGRRRLAPFDVAEILASRQRARGGPTAPPHGLYLETVLYDEGPRAVAAHAAHGLEEQG
jgi:tRNA pseudouridine38-40 synthase